MINLFSNIKAKKYEELLKKLEADIFTYQRGVNIPNLMKEDNFIAVVLSGSLEIIRNNYDGSRTIIEELLPESIFGTNISSLLNNDYDIIAKETSKIIFIEYDKIIEYQNPNDSAYNQLLKNLLEIINNKITSKNERIAILTQKTIRNKLLEYFKIVSQKNNSKTIYLVSTFTDLADYLAVDRCAMSREIKNLKNEGFIEIKNKVIKLLY